MVFGLADVQKRIWRVCALKRGDDDGTLRSSLVSYIRDDNANGLIRAVEPVLLGVTGHFLPEMGNSDLDLRLPVGKIVLRPMNELCRLDYFGVYESPPKAEREPRRMLVLPLPHGVVRAIERQFPAFVGDAG